MTRSATAALALLLATACGVPATPERLAAAPGSPDAVACPTEGTSAAIDWVDLVVVDGRTYSRQEPWPSAPELGGTVATTRCRMADSAGRTGGLRDGDATYLPVGTRLRSVAGFDPRFRLAAETPAGLVRYELDEVDGARTGADLLPGIASHVREVVLLETERGEGVVGRVAGTAAQEVVADLLAAPAAPFTGDRDRFLGLVLDDGTTVRRAYVTSSGLVFPGLRLPERARAHLATARP